MRVKPFIKNFILWPVIVLAIVIVIFRASLMPLLELGVNHWFKQQGLSSEIEDLTLDESDAIFSLAGLKAELNGSPVLSIERVSVEWSWSALWNHEVDLVTLNIDGVNLDIERGANDKLLIGGVDISEMETAKTGDPSQHEPSQWVLGLQSFNLSNLKVCYRDQAAADYCGRLDKLEWRGSINLNQDGLRENGIPLQVKGDLNLSGIRVEDNQFSRVLLSADDFSMREILVDTPDRISVETISFEQLAFLESGGADAQAQPTTFEKLQLDQFKLVSAKSPGRAAGNSKIPYDAKFSLSGFRGSSAGAQVFSVERIALDWSWAALRDQQIDLAAVEIDGLNFNIEQGAEDKLVIAGVNIAQPAAAETSDSSPPEPLQWKLRLQRLALTNPNVCYRDKAAADYCGRLDKLEWRGSINFNQDGLQATDIPLQVKGDLNLSGIRVDDNQFSRVLLSVGDFSMREILVDTPDRISVETISFEQLAFLESGGADAPAQPTTFEKLQLDQFKLVSAKSPGSTTENAQIPYDAKFSLSGIRGSSAGAQVFSVERIALDWSWAALRDQQIDLAAVEIDGLNFNIERGAEDKLVIAGVNIAQPAAAETSDSSPPEPLQWKLRLQRLALTNPNVCYRDAATIDYCGRFNQLGWKGSASLDLADLQAASLPLQLQGDFNLSGLSLVNKRTDRLLLGFEDFSVNSLRAETLNNISSESVLLDNLVLFERRKTDSIPQITRLESLQASRLKLENLISLNIAEINLLNHEVELVNQQDNKLEVDEWLQQAPLDQLVGMIDAKPDSSSASLAYTLDTLTYKTDKSIEYRDNSVKPAFVFDMNSIQLTLKNLDSSKPEQDSDVSYSAKIGKNAVVSAAGTAKPLQAKISFNLQGKIVGLDLREFSTFSSRAIGHNINSGQLDAKLKLLASNGVLDSEIDLTLNQFKLAALSAADQKELDSKLGFPLNASLSLLKDKNNRIKLKIPVKGDLQKPDFNPEDAITQAISTAVTTAVLLYYTPYGLVVIAEDLFNLATALKFDPLRFSAGVGDISSTDATTLEKIALLMKDRPGVDVTLCPFTNTEDRLQLLPETAEVQADQLELSSDQQTALTNLGELRSNQVKDYLLDKQIDTERLVLCQPAHKEGEGLGGVQISI